MSRKRLEIKEGERYGRLTVIRELEPNRSKSGKPKRKFLQKIRGKIKSKTKVGMNKNIC